jgi:hypothetical protein
LKCSKNWRGRQTPAAQGWHPRWVSWSWWGGVSPSSFSFSPSCPASPPAAQVAIYSRAGFSNQLIHWPASVHCVEMASACNE